MLFAAFCSARTLTSIAVRGGAAKIDGGRCHKASSVGGSARIASAKWDALSAQSKTDEAERRRLPGITLSAGYTRLSDLKSSVSIGPASFEIDSLDNVFTLAANMQYPVFAGFRLEESARLAALQAQSKEIASEMTKRAVAFETERAYWEAVRSTRNVAMLRENLGLMRQNLEQTKQQLAHGTVMNVDLLAAEMRCDQAEMDLCGTAKRSSAKCISRSILS